MAYANTMNGCAAHKALMLQFLQFLNVRCDAFVLKGGTALMMCYNLGRFSEDIDVDATAPVSIIAHVDAFCKENRLTYRVAKDTATVKRCVLHYTVNGMDATMKLEASYRMHEVQYATTRVNQIRTYTIDSLFQLKLQAFLGRDRIRDIYDILTIYMKYGNMLYPAARDDLKRALTEKSVDVILETIEQQSGAAYDVKQLESLYLNTCIALGVTFD